MKIQLSLIMVLLSISMIAATTLYAGNSETFESEQYEYYDVVGNSSNMDGMNISWENGNTTINFSIGFKQDNFTLTFFNNETKVITVYQSSGSSGGSSGGSSNRKTVYINNTEYVEIEKIVTNNVPGETIETEKVVTKIPKWAWILMGILIFTVSYLVFRNKDEYETEAEEVTRPEETTTEEPEEQTGEEYTAKKITEELQVEEIKTVEEPEHEIQNIVEKEEEKK